MARNTNIIKNEGILIMLDSQDRYILESQFSIVIRSELGTPFVCDWIDDDSLHLSLACLNAGGKLLLPAFEYQTDKLKKYLKNVWNIENVIKEGEVYRSKIEVRYGIRFKMTKELLEKLQTLLRMKGYNLNADLNV